MDVLVRDVSRRLVEEFDKAIEEDYQSRSEAIRDLMRHYVQQKLRKKE